MSMLLTVLLVAVSAFLFGFLIGTMNEPWEQPIKTERKKPQPLLNEEAESLTKEYKNFLQYDGSEQA